MCWVRLVGMAYGNFVELIGFAFDDTYRVLRTFTQTSAESVAVFIGDQFRFAVDDLDRPFGTSGNALAATVAEGFVDLNDFSLNHGVLWRCCRFWLIIWSHLALPYLDNFLLVRRAEASFRRFGSLGFLRGNNREFSVFLEFFPNTT